jgi:hypothetical protein
VTAGDTIHVLDNVSGRLLKYTPDGRLVLDRAVPRTLAEAAEESARLGREVFGATYSGGYAKRLKTTPDGRLLVLVDADPIWALLLNPSDYGGIALRVPDSAADAKHLLGATTAVLAGDDVFVVWEDDVIRYRLPDGLPGQARARQ